eukprot:768320-Hanusia_phi.AAC.19
MMMSHFSRMLNEGPPHLIVTAPLPAKRHHGWGAYSAHRKGGTWRRGRREVESKVYVGFTPVQQEIFKDSGVAQLDASSLSWSSNVHCGPKLEKSNQLAVHTDPHVANQKTGESTTLHSISGLEGNFSRVN